MPTVVPENPPQLHQLHAVPDRAAAKGTYAFVSLGCPKNLVDSERMLGLLQLDGYRLVHDPEGADFVVVNTCGFIERARQESYATIREMLELKRQGKTRGVIVSGCLAEREKDALLTECPEIDHLVGVFGREHVTKVADRLIGRPGRAADGLPAGPDCAAHRQEPAADHAAAFRLSENLRRLRPALHVLRDSQNARQACHQADGRSPGRGARAGRRRRPRVEHRGPGHAPTTASICTAGRGWPNC